tara:strand:+ start:7775 stop:8653 length:879 start_codon:yes stop_codon:yes gene_type:complete
MVWIYKKLLLNMKYSSKMSHLTSLEKERGQPIPESLDEINERSMRAFKEQSWYGDHFLSAFLGITNYENKKILEVGPAEAGLLHYFQTLGAQCTGIELSPLRFTHSQLLNRNSVIKLEKGDICDPSSYSNIISNEFDIIIIRDVIEHIDDKLMALKNMYKLLSPKGLLFISFPPRYCPYAGHQQTVKNFFCKIPYLHLLPNSIYKSYLKFFGHPSSGIEYLIATKRTRISIKKMEHLFLSSKFDILKKGLFFSRPAYRFRFGLPTFQNPFVWFPWLREIFTNGALYVLTRKS